MATPHRVEVLPALENCPMDAFLEPWGGIGPLRHENDSNVQVFSLPLFSEANEATGD